MKKALSVLLATVLLLTCIPLSTVSVSAYGDSISTATSISLNRYYSGEITAANERDFYKFTLTESGEVTLNMTAYIEELACYIYNISGESVWEVRYDWNWDTQVLQVNEALDLTSGTYYLAMCMNWGKVGDYSFKLGFDSTNENFSEGQGGNNNTLTVADKITFSKKYNGQIALNDEKDFYKFTLTKSGEVAISINAYFEEVACYIYDANSNSYWGGKYDWNWDTQALQINEKVDLTAGTYYLVFVKDWGKTGNYDFTLRYTNAKESFAETEKNTDNNTREANNIKLNTTYKGQIAANDDKDFYKFKISHGETITLTFKAYIEEVACYIYDSDGNQQWGYRYDWNWDTRLIQASEEITLSAGTYYISFIKDWGRTGNYSFKLSCDHTYKKVVVKKATLSANGSYKNVCTKCGYTASKKDTIYKASKVKLSKTAYTYNGKVQRPKVIVKDRKGKTISSKYYTVTYAKGCKNVGTYKVTVKFKGRYSGKKTLTFKINPAKTGVKTLSAGRKKLTVKWTKKTTQVSGYQIQYSTSKSFKSYKTKTLSGYKKTSTTLTGLKAKKTYYIRVRTYKTVNGKKVYSGWSTIKYKKTK